MPRFTPVMTPAPGERLVRFVGDQLVFQLRDAAGQPPPAGWRAFLRTNLGRGSTWLRELIQAHATGAPLAGASWRDIPMQPAADSWSLSLPLAETGWFQAKAYVLDERGWQHWPEGHDFGVSVHPDFARSANILYCAFPRLCGATRSLAQAGDAREEELWQTLDAGGCTVIPPSGKLRDLIPLLPHIVDRLGCRILHLLPVNPTPTTFARFGRYGSPYACLDLTAIDPALVVFDRRTTGVDQFCELARAVHGQGARLFLDIVINHTGWGSALQEQHPEWFERRADGAFHSPGAWDVTWEDLVELKHDNVALWDELAGALLTWCRRGVDGFRCDAGYLVPMPAWQYIVARVRQEFPDVLFLLEGLGGSWEASETLLTEGGMQWAYSELFQNHSGLQVSGYLDHAWHHSARAGLLVHYSETHDNPRLAAHVSTGMSPGQQAARARAWSLLRNRLCALASVSGGFGFTSGVEWLATEKIRVHGCTGLNWDAADNIVPEIARLNQLLASHPAFFDGAQCSRISADGTSVLAFTRRSAEGLDSLLVLVNLDVEREQAFVLSPAAARQAGLEDWPWPAHELLSQTRAPARPSESGEDTFHLPPAAVLCLAPAAQPRGLHGDAYRRARAQAAWAWQMLSQVQPIEALHRHSWRALAAEVERSPCEFLVRAGGQTKEPAFPKVIRWSLKDARRVTPIPPDHWLLIEDDVPFRATLEAADAGAPPCHVVSIAAAGRHHASFAPRGARLAGMDALLHHERLAPDAAQTPGCAQLRFLSAAASNLTAARVPESSAVALLTNGRGGMARIRVDLGRIESKYDGALAANLHPALPVDRHVFVKRVRAWLNADGFVTPLNFHALEDFEPGPPARWRFAAHAGDSRTVEIQLAVDMLPGRNTTRFLFHRPGGAPTEGRPLPDDAEVRLILRADLEDRNFHSETHRNQGAEHHFASHTSLTAGHPGFAFIPAADRQVRVFVSDGLFHAAPEWSERLAHTVEAARGQPASGDAWSPGWFEVPLRKGASATLLLCADPSDPSPEELAPFDQGGSAHGSGVAREADFESALRRATAVYVVRREEGRTIVAGYPWFLDWGRDTLIAARGLLAAGMTAEVREILFTFARYEEHGTLPNIIRGEHVGNRDTSDAPLWFGIVAGELAALTGGGKLRGHELFTSPLIPGGRTLADVLRSIAVNYVRGTPNGIRMDPGSALIFSPAHFTWMDTNHPAGTPRQGYPVEIQALWIHLLRLLDNVGVQPEQEPWSVLADRAEQSFLRCFWLEDRGWLADVLLAAPGQPAAQAIPDDALRSNCLLPISLGLLQGERARRTVEAARRWLLVPGALRSLAPLPLSVPLEIRGADGRLLSDPRQPYRGRYEGEEDTSRKPAYHNGTAWVWTFPGFCEALVQAWNGAPEAVAAARAYLGSTLPLLEAGCLGQLPECLDGDAPHAQRGCDAQAWSVTETLRVWRWLESPRA